MIRSWALRRLARCQHGSASAEMVLVLPILLTLLFVAIEFGNYVYSEHRLVESVRDGARYAARTNLANFPCGGTTNGALVTDTQSVVRTGLVTGGSDLLPTFSSGTASIAVSHSCTTDVAPDPAAPGSTVAMGGIFTGNPGGVPTVRIVANVPYRSVIGALTGSTALNFPLRAEQEAMVVGF